MKTVQNTINILKYVSGNGKSIRELSDHLKIKERTLINYLRALDNQGFLEKMGTKYKLGPDLALIILNNRFSRNEILKAYQVDN
jgi:DNA-binding IclR family transcriptional regulator